MARLCSVEHGFPGSSLPGCSSPCLQSGLLTLALSPTSRPLIFWIRSSCKLDRSQRISREVNTVVLVLVSATPTTSEDDIFSNVAGSSTISRSSFSPDKPCSSLSAWSRTLWARYCPAPACCFQTTPFASALVAWKLCIVCLLVHALHIYTWMQSMVLRSMPCTS